MSKDKKKDTGMLLEHAKNYFNGHISERQIYHIFELVFTEYELYGSIKAIEDIS